MEIREELLSEELCGELIALSQDWESENSCRGYRRNTRADLEGRRFFTAREDGALIGYAFGELCRAEKSNSVMDSDTAYFEIEELYVVPERRSQGIGRELFSFAEKALGGETEWIMLSTAAKDWKKILHFYLEELGMAFWSARLFKKLTD